MSVKAGQVACPSNAATQVVAAANANIVGSAGSGVPSRTVVLYNPSAQAIYIGGDATVTSSNGFEMPVGGEPVTLQLRPGDAIWGIGASSTPTLHYIESAA